MLSLCADLHPVGPLVLQVLAQELDDQVDLQGCTKCIQTSDNSQIEGVVNSNNHRQTCRQVWLPASRCAMNSWTTGHKKSGMSHTGLVHVLQHMNMRTVTLVQEHVLQHMNMRTVTLVQEQATPVQHSNPRHTVSQAQHRQVLCVPRCIHGPLSAKPSKAQATPSQTCHTLNETSSV